VTEIGAGHPSRPQGAAGGDAAATYTGTAKLLHWAVAAAVIALLALGLVMTRVAMPLGEKFTLYQLHKSIGLTVLALMIVRAWWRLFHPAPALPSTMPALERRAAHVAHAAFYVLLIAMPISGWLMVSASPLPLPTRYFGLFTVPHLELLAALPIAARRPYFDALRELHMVLGFTLLALVAVHVAAALRHQLVLRDGLLGRMLPGRRGAALVAIALGLAAGDGVRSPLLAQEAPRWTVDPAKSSITAEAVAAGQRYPVRFEAFTAEIRFDPAAPERTRVAVTIKTASARTGTGDIDSELAGAEWFNARQFPEATFAADKAEKTGDGAYKLTGTLTIKGKSRPVDVPFRLGLQGIRAKAEGEAVVDRIDFGVGPAGPVAGAVIDRPVRVRLVIEADRAG
jgi:cytochrome b561